MEYEWIGTAIALTSMLSLVSIGVLKFAHSIDKDKLRERIKAKRKNILLKMVEDTGKSKASDKEIEAIFKETNKKLEYYDEAKFLLKNYSEPLTKAIQFAIGGFGCVIFASLLETGDIQIVILLIGAICYIFSISSLYEGTKTCHNASKKYDEIMDDEESFDEDESQSD